MYRKNTAGTITFAMIDAATGAGTAGLTVTGVRSIDGGAQAAVTGTFTSLGGGQYKFAAAAGDLNGNNIGFLFTATGMIPVNVNVTTTAADLSDGVRQGLTSLPNATPGASGGLPTTNGSKLNQTADLTAGQTIAATIAAGAIATDAITAASVKADAVTKIQNGLATGTNLATVDTVVDAIKAKTDLLAFTGNDVKATLDGELVTLAATQGSYAPAKAGDAMALTSEERTTLTASIWNALTSGITTANSIGKRIIDYLTGDAFARLGAPAGASVSADIAAAKVDTAAIKAKTDSLTFTGAGRVDANIKAIEDQLTSGNNATLKLKTVEIQNYSGAAVSLFGDFGLQIGGIARAISAIGFDGVGVYVQGNSNAPASTTPGLQIIGGTTGKDIAAKEIDEIKAKTDLLSFTGNDVKATLDGEKVEATIAAGDIATDAITAAAVKADAVTKIQDGLSKPGTAQTITPPADMALNSTVAKEAAATSNYNQLNMILDGLSTTIGSTADDVAEIQQSLIDGHIVEE